MNRLKPFSHDGKNQHSLQICLTVCELLQNELHVKRTLMFYMSYIPCEMFANIEKFCRRSRSTTKFYASVIFRMEPCGLLMWNDPLFFYRRPVRKRSYCACVKTHRVQFSTCMHCTRPAEMITHVSMCTTSVLHDRSPFFDVSQQCSSVFTHVFVISSVDISTHNSEMLMSVLLQN